MHQMFLNTEEHLLTLNESISPSLMFNWLSCVYQLLLDVSNNQAVFPEKNHEAIYHSITEFFKL